MRVWVYIDGFNLYYRACKKKSGTKWLDVSALATRLMPHDQVERIKYYTARVKSSPLNPNVHVRQDAYLQALATLPSLEIVEGRYQYGEKLAREATPPHAKVKILHAEEKGSDVNLATHLLYDGCRGLYEKAVLISNDSDLAEPVRIVAREIGLPVIVVNPSDPVDSNRPARELKLHATDCRSIRLAAVRACQFPDPVIAADGSAIRKPANW